LIKIKKKRIEKNCDV